jgi:hypothetical protein
MARPLQIQAVEKVQPRGSAECCIFLFLMGGPPQMDTFDVKEGKWTPSDFDIRTVKPGIRMPDGLLPKLCDRMEHLMLARSVEAWEGVHERGQYYIQAGRAFTAARVNEIPSVGSIIAYEFLSRRKDSDYLPPFVGMNFSTMGAGHLALVGSGMLPATCAPLPLTVQADGDMPWVVQDDERDRFHHRWDFLQRLEEAQLDGNTRLGRPVKDHQDFYLGAYELLRRPELTKVLKISEEDRKRYGSSSLGDACILARNLVEADAGTHYISVEHNGWDLHAGIYDKSKKVNLYTECRELDDAYSGLLDDLSKTKDKNGRTLLDKTLIVCMGEFGRTPGALTLGKGRDHYRYASTTVFSGGGVKGGRALGATDESGAKVISPGWHLKRSIYTEDVVTTIFSVLGIDWTKKITTTPSGRVFEYIEATSATNFLNPGEVSELFA